MGPRAPGFPSRPSIPATRNGEWLSDCSDNSRRQPSIWIWIRRDEALARLTCGSWHSNVASPSFASRWADRAWWTIIFRCLAVSSDGVVLWGERHKLIRKYFDRGLFVQTLNWLGERDDRNPVCRSARLLSDARMIYDIVIGSHHHTHEAANTSFNLNPFSIYINATSTSECASRSGSLNDAAAIWWNPKSLLCVSTVLHNNSERTNCKWYLSFKPSWTSEYRGLFTILSESVCWMSFRGKWNWNLRDEHFPPPRISILDSAETILGK